MKKMNIFPYGILVLILAVPVSLAYSSPQQSLRGISAVAIRVDALPESIRNDGVSEITIKENVEKQFRKEKIRVVEYEQWESTLGGSYLKIRIIPSKSYSGDQYVIYTQIELIQHVTLIRPQVENDKLIKANTWQAGKLMNCITQSVDDCLQGGISQIVEIFITELKKMN